mgnify:CR=1 FL=1
MESLKDNTKVLNIAIFQTDGKFYYHIWSSFWGFLRRDRRHSWYPSLPTSILFSFYIIKASAFYLSEFNLHSYFFSRFKSYFYINDSTLTVLALFLIDIIIPRAWWWDKSPSSHTNLLNVGKWQFLLSFIVLAIVFIILQGEMIIYA